MPINPSRRTWILSILFLFACLGFHWGALAFIDRIVTSYPSIPDPLMGHLPIVTFGAWGELLFLALFLLFAIPHFRYNWRATPRVLIQAGLVYFIRAWFLVLLPIGSPAGSIPASERLSIWGFANHAYFPGGHMGVLTVYAMNLPVKGLRPLMWVLVVLFAIGTVLNKNHYTADVLGGYLVGLLAISWGKMLYDRWFPDPKRA